MYKMWTVEPWRLNKYIKDRPTKQPRIVWRLRDLSTHYFLASSIGLLSDISSRKCADDGLAQRHNTRKRERKNKQLKNLVTRCSRPGRALKGLSGKSASGVSNPGHLLPDLVHTQSVEKVLVCATVTAMHFLFSGDRHLCSHISLIAVAF